MSMGQDKMEDRINKDPSPIPQGSQGCTSAGAGQAMPKVAIGGSPSLDYANYEMKGLLTQAKNDIQGLRRHNEILSAQMGVIDVFAAALGLKRDSGGMCPDITWELQRKIDELSAAQASLY